MTSLYKNSEGNTCKNVEVVAEKVSFLGYPAKEKNSDNDPETKTNKETEKTM